MAIKTPQIERQGIGQPATRAPRLISSDRGKWTRIPKARRTIAELTEIIKRVVQQTYFPLVRAYNIFAHTTTSEVVITEFVDISSDGTIWLGNEEGGDTYIHGDSTIVDDPIYGTYGAAYVGGWNTNTNTQSPGAVWCDDGPMIHHNRLRLPLNDSNVAQITVFDSCDATEEYILKATRNGDHDITLEFDNGGKLVKVGHANDEGAQVYRPTFPIPNAAVTTIDFNNESWDTDEIHDNSTNPSRLTCKTPGRYLITANVRFAPNSDGYRVVRIQRTDASIPATTPVASKTRGTVPGMPTDLDLHQIVWMSLNDYVELEVYQTSGSTLNLLQSNWDTPVFTMQKIDG